MQTLIDGFDKISQIEEKMLSKMTHFAQYDDIPYVADFKCPDCGKIIERDYNAALNILDEGKRILLLET